MHPSLARCAHALGASTVRPLERIQTLWSGYGEILRVTVDDGPVPTAILKRITPPAHPSHPRGWSGAAGHARKLRSYEVEAHWYGSYASRCPDECRVPRAYLVEPGLFVLEDLDAAGFGGRAHSVDDRQLEQCLVWLASLHRTFLREEPIGLWPRGTYWHLETRPDELAVMPPGELRDAAAAIDARLETAPCRTLVHGDAKPANFCFGPRAAAVDFQYVGGGIGIQDVVYLLGCLDDARLRRDHDHWVDRYFEWLGDDDAESAWRPLIRFAWADFERFLAGWSPGHRKRHRFAAEQTSLALASL